MKKLLVSLLIFVLGIYVAGFFLPSEWGVQRSRVIDADRALIHSYVADLHTWPDWTAWGREQDLDCEWSFSGEPLGEGASYSWDGPVLETGTLTITDASLGAGIDFSLTFGEASDPVYGSIKYADAEGPGDDVEVTFSLWGVQEGSTGRWAGLLMDSLAGPDLEKGLEGLDRACKTGLAGRLEQGAKDLLEEITD